VYHCENWHASNCTETEETWARLNVSVSQKVRIERHERSQELIDGKRDQDGRDRGGEKGARVMRLSRDRID